MGKNLDKCRIVTVECAEHGTRATLRLHRLDVGKPLADVLSRQQRVRLHRLLCGIKGCKCRDRWFYWIEAWDLGEGRDRSATWRADLCTK